MTQQGQRAAPPASADRAARAEQLKRRVRRTITRVDGMYEGHGRLFRLLWSLAGVVLVLAGLAMLVLPGPAMVIIPLGLAMLAAQAGWARRLLLASVDRGVDAGQRLGAARTWVKLMTGLLLLCLVATAAMLFVL